MDIALVVNGVFGEFREVLWCKKDVEGGVFKVLGFFEARGFPGGGKEVDHFGPSFVVYEDVGGSDISNPPSVLPHIHLGSHQCEQQVPQLRLLEEGLFWLPPLDFLLEIDGKVRIIILDKMKFTMAVPVLPHISLSCWKPVCSGSSKN